MGPFERLVRRKSAGPHCQFRLVLDSSSYDEGEERRSRMEIGEQGPMDKVLVGGGGDDGRGVKCYAIDMRIRQE